jgi:hypothetical protein
MLGEAAIENPTGVGEALLYLFLAHLHCCPTCIGYVLSLYHRKEASETIGSDSKAEWPKVCRRSLSIHRVAEKGNSRKPISRILRGYTLGPVLSPPSDPSGMERLHKMLWARIKMQGPAFRRQVETVLEGARSTRLPSDGLRHH